MAEVIGSTGAGADSAWYPCPHCRAWLFSHRFPERLRIAKATIADYADTAGRTIKTIAERNGKQPGDPRKAARAIIKAVESPHPPLRLVLGADAVERVTNKLAAVRHDLDDWREVSMGTALECFGNPGR